MAGQFKTKRRKGENYRLILPGVLIALALVTTRQPVPTITMIFSLIFLNLFPEWTMR